MARVPPYSRTQSQVSRTGLSPAVARRSRRFRYLESVPLAWSAFARHYSRSLILMSFPPATEMFQFAGFASRTYGFSTGYPRGWVAPFGDPGINDRSHLPRAFRSVPRPSSPLSAKASTRCPSFALRAPHPTANTIGARSRRCSRNACRGSVIATQSPGAILSIQKTLRAGSTTAQPCCTGPSRSVTQLASSQLSISNTRPV